MGFNPLRRYRGGKTLDIVILIAIPATLLLLAFWATR